MTKHNKPRTHVTRTPEYGERRKNHTLTLTDTAWDGLRRLSGLYDLSISDLVEKIGRGNPPQLEFQKVCKKVSETT